MRMPRAPFYRSLAKILSLVWVVLISPPSAIPQSGNPDLDRAAAGWDSVFREMKIPEVGPQTSFAAYCAERLVREHRLRRGDSAMVLAMGDGRNALYLANLGLKVTGIDISSVGLEKARQTAADRSLQIEAIRADLFRYDLGEDSWDLVTNVYFNPSIHILDRIKAAVRPGGYLLVEGYGSDHLGTGPPTETRYRPNQLLAELSNWRILEYQDGVFLSDWAGGRSVPVVRILAEKPQ
jgi:SAM-dependent methyltransferase